MDEIICNCDPKCPYFPDMSCDSWEMGEDGIKRRKRPKVYKCLYDLKPIDWQRECPRILAKDNVDNEDGEIEEYEYTKIE